MAVNFPPSTYQGQAQRFVLPLWIIDQQGGYKFSSTATFLEFENNFFCIFAHHAFIDAVSLDNIGFANFNDLSIHPLASMIADFRIHQEYDIVICSFPEKIQGKNYFNLSDDKSSLSTFEKDSFSWIGFPATKAINNFKKIWADGKIVPRVVHDNGSVQWNDAKFRIIRATDLQDDDIYITGYSPTKNVNFKIEGQKSEAPLPEGMSGGALFQRPKDEDKIDLSEPLNDLFYFRGMGIEYSKKGIVKGVSRNKIIELLNDFLSSSNKNK